MLEERTERESINQEPQGARGVEAVRPEKEPFTDRETSGSTDEAAIERKIGDADETMLKQGENKAAGQAAASPGLATSARRRRPVPCPADWLLSLAAVAAAYLYVSVFGFPTALGHVIGRSYYWGNGFAFMGLFLLLFTVVFLATGLGYVRRQGRKTPRAGWGYAALVVAAAVWFPLCADYDQDIFYYMLLLLHGAAVYWLLVINDNRSGEYLDERSLMDLGRGFLVLPFSGYLRIFGAWSNLFSQLFDRKKRPGNRGWQILLGVGISVPVLVLVGPMLAAADSYFLQFTQLLQAGFGNFFESWRFSVNGMGLFFTMLAACYLYGLFYNAHHKPAVRREKRLQAPQTMMGSFLAPLVLLYLVFFAVRLFGVAGAMEQIAGGELRISTYARESFFELCRVAAVNLAVFLLARWYSPKAKKGVRLLLGGLGIETLAFIVLAFSKMWYYIESYHSFTFKRALCCWLLITLFVLFALMVAELWNRQVKGVRTGVLFGCVSFLIMAYSNLPAWAP